MILIACLVLMNVENTLLLGMVDLCMKKRTSTLAGPVPDRKGLDQPACQGEWKKCKREEE
jgi:hypothetical protein